MSVNETSISWNGASNPAWGLVTKIGPYKMTSKDQKKLNSRAGGPHAGHANFFYSFRPDVFIKSSYLPPVYINTSVLTAEDYEAPKGLKIPGINRGGSNSKTGITGKRIEEIYKHNEQVLQNPEQGGLSVGNDGSFIKRNLSRSVVVDDDEDMFASNDIPGSPVTRSSIGSRRESGTFNSPFKALEYVSSLPDEGITFADRPTRYRNTFKNPSTSSSMSE